MKLAEQTVYDITLYSSELLLSVDSAWQQSIKYIETYGDTLNTMTKWSSISLMATP